MAEPSRSAFGPPASAGSLPPASAGSLRNYSPSNASRPGSGTLFLRAEPGASRSPVGERAVVQPASPQTVPVKVLLPSELPYASAQPFAQDTYSSSYRPSSQPMIRPSQRADFVGPNLERGIVGSVEAAGYVGDTVSVGYNAVSGGIYHVGNKIYYEGEKLVGEKTEGGCLPDLIALYLLVMLLVIPVWSAVKLLHDPTFMYFCGERLPTALLYLCAGLVSVFASTAIIMTTFAKKKYHTEQNVMAALILFLLALAAGLLVFHLAFQKQAGSAVNELMQNCNMGPRTGPLYDEYTALTNLRNSNVSCLSMSTVEKCPGYNETATDYAPVLKSIEMDLMCAGFCYTPPLTGAVNITLSSIVNITSFYPRALFSPLLHQGSCQGMAGRHLKTVVGDLATGFLFEALFLIGACIVVGYLQMFGMCIKGPAPRTKSVMKAATPSPAYGTLMT
mmetsp:Transcript_130508/g.226791  ORF Transcript_130508/g.226791 Transcript_130508/m.226791 type:complete len:448 (-) Transcript_130508:81-1424(-)